MHTHDHEHHDCDDEDCFEPAGDIPEEEGELLEVPEGAAVLPLIPEELGVDPLLVSTLHAFVFVAASSDEVVHKAAGEEALQYLLTYLQRIKGERLARLKEDMETLIGFAKGEGWPREDQRFLKEFVKEFVL